MISLRNMLFKNFFWPNVMAIMLLSIVFVVLKAYSFKSVNNKWLQETASLIAISSEYGLSIGSEDEVARVATRIIDSRDDIIEIKFYDESGDSFYRSQKKSTINHGPFVDVMSYLISGSTEGISSLRVPIHITENPLMNPNNDEVNRSIGYIEVVHNFKHNLQYELDGFLGTFLNIILIFLLIGIYSRVISMKLSKPINALNEAYKTLSREGQVSLPSSKTKEFNELNKSFLGMSSEIIDYQKNLKNKINEATESLRVQNNELVKKNHEAMAATRAKGQFLSNISHEFKTPLSGIRVLCSTIDEELRTGNYQNVQKHVARIVVAQQSLISLINEILHYSEIDSGSINLQYKMCSPNKMIERVISSILPLAYSKQLNVFNVSGVGLSEFSIDERHLERVINNVISNAVKYTNNGNIFVQYSFDKVNSFLVFTVKDSGIGIDTNQINEIFKPFSQSDSSDTRVYDGTGLGLAISKSLIEKMGGRIEVQSVKGLGSKFDIFVPVNECTIIDPHPVKDRSSSLSIGLIYTNKGGAEAVISNLKISGYYNIRLIDSIDDLSNHTDLDVLIGDDPALNDSDVYAIRQLLPKVYLIKVSRILNSQRVSEKDNYKNGINEYWSTSVSANDIARYMKNAFDKTFESDDEDHTKQIQNIIFESESSDMSDKPLYKLRVLLVEDNHLLQNILTTNLRKFGAIVSVASNGSEALQRTENLRYDCILMDLQMPVMSGEETVTILREKYTCLPPIICLTATHLNEDRLARIHMLFDEIVFKTDDNKILIDKIRSLCEKN